MVFLFINPTRHDTKYNHLISLVVSPPDDLPRAAIDHRRSHAECEHPWLPRVCHLHQRLSWVLPVVRHTHHRRDAECQQEDSANHLDGRVLQHGTGGKGTCVSICLVVPPTLTVKV